MSFEPDFIPYPSSMGTDAKKKKMEPDLFFAPDLQPAFAPSPESFDRDCDFNDREFEDLELSFKEFDDFFATFAVPIAPTPSAVTDSTESVYSSQYSCLTPSEYSIPSEIESCGSLYDGLYSTHAPAEAVTVQESATIPSFAPAHVVPNEAHEPVKPFKCHVCEFSSARKHNLKTHIATHDREASKRFECRTCKRRFTRKHDLRRHREVIHKEQMSRSSSSRSSASSTSGNPTPMPSAYPDYDATIGVPEDFIAWLLGEQGVVM